MNETYKEIDPRRGLSFKEKANYSRKSRDYCNPLDVNGIRLTNHAVEISHL
jgi:hypothetical protein